MKPTCLRFEKSLTIRLSLLLVGTALFLCSSRSQARDGAAFAGGGHGFVAAAAGYRAGYGYGYDSGYYNNYPVVVATTPVTSSGGSVSSLPTGAVATLPTGASTVVVFGKTYYFANGNYYSPVFYGGSTVYIPANP